jgi:hypothetical protein
LSISVLIEHYGLGHSGTSKKAIRCPKIAGR